MLPSHSLFRRFENKLNVGTQKLEWAIWDDNFVFRPQEADEVIVWFLLGRRDIPSRLHPQHNVANIKDCEIRIEQAVYGRQLWRWGQLPSGEECFLRKNYGILRTVKNELVRFDFPFAFSNFEQAKSDEIEAFYKMLSSPDSDLETAKRWAGTSNQQRVRQLFQLSGGSHDELEALIQASLVFRKESETTFSLRIVVPGRVLLRHVDKWYGTTYSHHGREVSPDPFFDILNRYFYL